MEQPSLTQHEAAQLRTGLAQTVYGIVENHASGMSLGNEETSQLQFIRDQRGVGGAQEITPGQRIADELVLGLLLDRYSRTTGEAAPGYFAFDEGLIDEESLDAVLRNLTSPDSNPNGRFSLRGELGRIKHLTDSGEVAVPYHGKTGDLYYPAGSETVQTHKLQSITSGSGRGFFGRGIYRATHHGQYPPLTHVARAAEDALIQHGVWKPEIEQSVAHHRAR